MEETVHADRIIVMDHGRIARDSNGMEMDGTPREIFSRVEELHALGLAAPETVELLHDLNAHGMELPLDAITVEECADAIASALQEE
jgi:energy-coupling factor transport system ATP-binding protein